MYNVRKVTQDLYWIGANDRRLALFEGVYKIPKGVSYNSYVLLDEKTVVFDTVDASVSRQYLENLAHVLGGRKLDYVIVQHMEMDHAATLGDLVKHYPEVTIVCNEKVAQIMEQFFDFDVRSRLHLVAEGDTFCTGRHTFTFVAAPMVHWPEVMVTYDIGEKILFSADAFGTFGALNGALFADEVDFFGDYLEEARRYYTNIVGKYGKQVQDVLKKASGIEIKMVCPLHGFVWRKKFNQFLEKYIQWATYTPEETGVVIAYASIYGNTANVADILAAKLTERGIKVAVYDASYTAADEILAAAFRYSHLVFASATYNAGIYIAMDDLLRDIVNHNLQNRTVAFVENGSWAPAAGGQMRQLMAQIPGTKFIDQTVTVRSALKERQMTEIDALVDAIAATIPGTKPAVPSKQEVMNMLQNDPAKLLTMIVSAKMQKAPACDTPVDGVAFQKFSYGLFVLTAKDGAKDNGCIINTASQLTDNPKRITIAVNKANYTRDMILNTGVFNVSVLTEDASMEIFQRFGFQSGKTADKFAGCDYVQRAANGVYYVKEATNAVISGKVIASQDVGTHTLFIADVTEARVLSQEPSLTYAYYFAHVKPKPLPAAMTEAPKAGWICKICGYVYEGEELPPDYICPICKHGAVDFERIVPEGAPAPEPAPAPAPAPMSKKKRWICRVCGYVYEGYDLPDDYVCPVCKRGADVFVLEK